VIHPALPGSGVEPDGRAGAPTTACPSPAGSEHPVLPTKPHDSCLDGGFANTGALVPGVAIRIAQIRDGTSNTLLVGELSWPAVSEAGWARGQSDGSCSTVYTAKNVMYPMGTYGTADDAVPSLVPVRYTAPSSSGLTHDVRPRRTNRADFALTSTTPAPAPRR